MKTGHVYYKRGGFRVVGTDKGTYHVQAKVIGLDPSFTPAGCGKVLAESWVSIDTFDYLANARARVRALHEA